MKILPIIVFSAALVAAGCTKTITYCGQQIPENAEEIYCLGQDFEYGSGLNGIDQFKRVRRLYLAGALLEDVTPLGKLTELRHLSLLATRVSDIRPLANLHKLEGLDISSTRVRDVSVLENFPMLEKLAISGLHLVDATPIYALPFLKVLQCGYARLPTTQYDPLMSYLKAKGVKLIRR